jgi:hypothetical protein
MIADALQKQAADPDGREMTMAANSLQKQRID